MNHTYNGYTNYATWNISLWINNDYNLYREKEALLRNADIGDITPTFAQKLVEQGLGLTMTADLTEDEWLTIDWNEIADEFRQEKKEQA